MNIKERIKENWQIKILAVLMGLILWFYVVKVASVRLHGHKLSNNSETSENAQVR